MRASVVKRSVKIGGHKTGVSLEERFWQALQDIARARGASVTALLGAIDGRRNGGATFASHIRVFVLEYFRPAPPRS
jgi:predicted DNA-binding ribbon-helix-helix protein